MEERKYKYEMKPLFKERMQKLLPNKEEFNNFEKIVHTSPLNYIRCNTLKISPEELKKRLERKWKIVQPYKDYPEIMLIESNLLPGELGNSQEHLLGYYYVQEICSMMSPIALNPQPGELILDLFASPGSKTSQIASMMKNEGTLIANDLRLDRIAILASNLERCAVLNTIVTRQDAVDLCAKLIKKKMKFDKILADAPCSGDGTLRSSPKTFLMWNVKVVKKLARQQKKFISFALKCLKKDGILIYSTCTHAPEENEEVLDFAKRNFPIKIEKIKLPIKCREGITNWNEKELNKEISNSCRIYPQDNNSEGFFVSKITLLEEIN
jgi:NOL1/NOP2/sun family putative RNA methylase